MSEVEKEMQALARRMKELKAQRDAKTVTGKYTYEASGDDEGLFIQDLDDSNIKTDIKDVDVTKKTIYKVAGRNFCLLRKKDGSQAEFVEEGEEYVGN